MAIENFVFEGTFKWARVFSPQTFQDGTSAYTLSFYPKDGEVRKAVKATGIRNAVKEDDDGFYYQFRRKAEDGAPQVVDTDGNKVDKLIGNGTKGKLKLAVETFMSPKHGKVTRSKIVGIMVTELVEYVPEPKPDAEKPKANPMDDEIPF